MCGIDIGVDADPVAEEARKATESVEAVANTEPLGAVSACGTAQPTGPAMIHIRGNGAARVFTKALIGTAGIRTGLWVGGSTLGAVTRFVGFTRIKAGPAVRVIAA